VEGRGEESKGCQRVARTVGETGVKIVGDGIVELAVDCVDEELPISVGH
jgi:hypothetical protein